MDPVAVLLNDMPVKFVDSKSSELPPSVGSSEPPCSSSYNSYDAKVLIELGFVDFTDTISSNRD